MLTGARSPDTPAPGPSHSAWRWGSRGGTRGAEQRGLNCSAARRRGNVAKSLPRRGCDTRRPELCPRGVLRARRHPAWGRLTVPRRPVRESPQPEVPGESHERIQERFWVGGFRPYEAPMRRAARCAAGFGAARTPEGSEVRDLVLFLRGCRADNGLADRPFDIYRADSAPDRTRPTPHLSRGRHGAQWAPRRAPTRARAEKAAAPPGAAGCPDLPVRPSRWAPARGSCRAVPCPDAGC